MLFIMFCEVFYLLVWASVSYAFGSDELPAAFSLTPWLAGRVFGCGDRVFLRCCPTIPCGINRFSCLCAARPGITSLFSYCAHGVIGRGGGLYRSTQSFWVEASMLNLLPFTGDFFAVPTPCAPQQLRFGLFCFQKMRARWRRLDSCNTISLFCLTQRSACCSGGARNEISLGLNFSIHMTWEISIWRA